EAHLVADPEAVGGLHVMAVHTHVPALAGGCTERAGLDQAYGPDPAVDAHTPAVRRPGRLGGGDRSSDLGVDARHGSPGAAGRPRLLGVADRACALGFAGRGRLPGGVLPVLLLASFG